MKILMINKFLYPKGGAETYMLKLGAHLARLGHEVEYFGMEHPDNSVGNRVGAYTASMDFHGGSRLAKLSYPLRVIYSSEARKKIRQVLEDFAPDVCHLNNFNYQLTPSMILEIRSWSRESGHPCRIVYTAHDYQLLCPNHMCLRPGDQTVCERCLGGHYLHCLRGRCVHGSLARSAVGAAEALLWRAAGVYRELDLVICCSHFMKSMLDTEPVFSGKTTVLHNFVDAKPGQKTKKKDYVLYFGRYSQEKGIETLVQAAKELPDIPFVFAGSGPLEPLLEGVSNIRNAGFQSGAALEKLIREARFSVYPSEWYENCPFSVIESQMYGTPVLGADIGGIPELIRPGVTGELFRSGDLSDLKEKLSLLWQKTVQGGCAVTERETACFLTADDYCRHYLALLKGQEEEE